MAGNVDLTSFQRALDELRFDDAASIIDGGASDDSERLRARLEAQREDAERRAHELYQRLTDLADDGAYALVLGIQEQESTDSLLALLSDTHRDRAALFFRNASRWLDSQVQTARRRLGDARKALGGLDLQLARGLLARVDNRYLTEDEIAEKDALILEVSARSMELESLEETSGRLIEESRPKRRRWWRRS